jgi:hypothetical protein
MCCEQFVTRNSDLSQGWSSDGEVTLFTHGRNGKRLLTQKHLTLGAGLSVNKLGLPRSDREREENCKLIESHSDDRRQVQRSLRLFPLQCHVAPESAQVSQGTQSVGQRDAVLRGTFGAHADRKERNNAV